MCCWLFRVLIGGNGNSPFSCESPERWFQGQSDDVCTSPVWILIKVSLRMIIQDLHVSCSLLRSSALQMTLNILCWCVFLVYEQEYVCVWMHLHVMFQHPQASCCLSLVLYFLAVQSTVFWWQRCSAFNNTVMLTAKSSHMYCTWYLKFICFLSCFPLKLNSVISFVTPESCFCSFQHQSSRLW